MLRSLGKTFALAVLLMGGTIALYVYHHHSSAEYQIEQLQQQKRELENVINRLQADRRVAKILATRQQSPDGGIRTTLLFVEYARDGSALPARTFTIDGNEAHFDAEIVKFKDDYVKQGDPLRGQSIILFTRVYGAHQAPADGFPIDSPGAVPEIYRGADPQISDFEQKIWNTFWTLYNDKAAREAIGIRGLHGEGLYGNFDPDHLYTITLRADGDGTINEEPLEPIYRDALKQK
jgi:hypothetical protein